MTELEQALEELRGKTDDEIYIYSELNHDPQMLRRAARQILRERKAERERLDKEKQSKIETDRHTATIEISNKGVRWTIWTFWVAVATGILALIGVVIQAIERWWPSAR